MNYTKFKLRHEDIFKEAYTRCLKEMFLRAQPSVKYDDLLKDHRNRVKQGLEPIRYFERYYLSSEEFKYILNKYIDSYNFTEHFRKNIDVIIDDLKNGYSTNKMIQKDNNPPYRGYEEKPKLSKIIGTENADKVIKIIEDRKQFYRFDRDESDFSIAISLGCSPTSNEQTVIEYWKTQNVDIKINPRHYDDDYFWCEENGYDYDEITKYY